MKSIFDAAIKNDTVPNHETKEERFQSVFKATARSAALGFAIEAFNENYNSVRIPFDTSLVNISGEVPYKEDSDSISSKVPYEPCLLYTSMLRPLLEVPGQAQQQVHQLVQRSVL